MLRLPVAIVAGILPLAVVLAVAVAMRGGSTAPSEAAFVAQATAICQAGMTERDALAKPRTPGQVFPYLNAGIRSLHEEIAQLRALRAPAAAGTLMRAGLADEDRMLAAMGQMISRRDYIRLAVTLPHHPAAVPASLRGWQARERALNTDVQVNLRAAGLSGCLR